MMNARTNRTTEHCGCPQCGESLLFKFADEEPRTQTPTAACYQANFTYVKDGADITRKVVFDDNRDLVVQINPRLSTEEVEQCLAEIIADIKLNGLYSLERARVAAAKRSLDYNRVAAGRDWDLPFLTRSNKVADRANYFAVQCNSGSLPPTPGNDPAARYGTMSLQFYVE